MLKGFFAACASLLFVSFFATAAMALDFHEGKWSMTVNIKMKNMPADQQAAMQKAQAQMQAEQAQLQAQMQNVPPQYQAQMQKAIAKMQQQYADINQGHIGSTFTQCMTKQNFIPKASSSQVSCQETHTINGNTVNYHTTCTSEGGWQTDIKGIGIYTGDSMQARAHMHGGQGSKTMDEDVDITGHYVGPCD